ncbi:InlB B-repeat-containing protein [Floccifex sp.]|uniref:InlB B-repeat-containing protein n=1 Tax=Floccifex sp. TaxID=2815810 RepID=UPI003F1195CF
MNKACLSIIAENIILKDSAGGGKINGDIFLDSQCTFTLESGEVNGDISNHGTFYADGGTVLKNVQNYSTITQRTGTAGTVFNDFVGSSEYTIISGGVFNAQVLNTGNSCITNGVFNGQVNNGGSGYISGGVFNGQVKNYNSISGGVFNGQVENNNSISGGVFYDKVLNKSENNYIGNISGGVFYGGIEHNGGTITDPYHTVSFDLNGASGTVPVTQYFVNTNTAQALEPDDPVKEGYEFAGWYNGETKYNFTENVTGSIALKAEWKNVEAPVITGLEDGKTYCDTVQFEVSDNVGVTSVTANGVELIPDSNGKYSLEKGKGTLTVVVKDKAGNEKKVTVTVNDGHSLEHFDAKEASVSDTGNIEYWQCKDCDHYFSDENGTKEITLKDTVISKKAPEIINGKGQSVTQGTKKELSFTSNAAFNEFKYVKLDGKELNSKNYTVKEGSIIVTLNKDFVSTLKAGKHTISIVSETGEASTEFEVIKKEVDKDSSNKTNTGIIGNAGLWISMMVSSLDALLIGFILKRKNRK